MHQANVRLGPVRRAKQGLVDGAFDELADLYRLWETRDLVALKSALTAYHERRRRLVPQTIAMVNRAAAYLRR